MRAVRTCVAATCGFPPPPPPPPPTHPCARHAPFVRRDPLSAPTAPPRPLSATVGVLPAALLTTTTQDTAFLDPPTSRPPRLSRYPPSSFPSQHPPPSPPHSLPLHTHRLRRSGPLSVASSSLKRCYTSVGTIRIVWDGEPRTTTPTFTQLLTSVVTFCECLLYVFTETIRIFRDGEPSTPTSTFTQLLSSVGTSSSSNIALGPQRP